MFLADVSTQLQIVSYIDPKESISDGKLRRWVNESASTYFSLFLRLATIFFVMLLVEIISSSVLSDDSGESYIGAQIDDTAYSIWIYLFLVIGAFMFAKQVPKMIESIFGIKGSGDLHLNPFKNEGFGALAGGAVGAWHRSSRCSNWVWNWSNCFWYIRRL